MKSINLLQNEPKKLFMPYIIPPIYILADTIIIGKGIGVLNLLIPLF